MEQLVEGAVFVDGGTAWGLDIPLAVQRCKEIVKKDEDIIIDVILTKGFVLPPINVTEMRTLDMYYYNNDIFALYKTMKAFDQQVVEYPNVTVRSVMYPKEQLPSGNTPIFFNHDQMEAMIQKGFMDGVEAAKNAKSGLHARAGIDYLKYTQSRRRVSERMSFEEFVETNFPEYVLAKKEEVEKVLPK